MIRTSGAKLYFYSTTNPVAGATTLIVGHRYHVCYQAGPNGRAIYMTDLTAGTSGVRDGYLAVPSAGAPGTKTFYLRQFDAAGTYAFGDGYGVDELAIFASERYSGTTYTAPSGPFTGSEPDLVALYHLDETTGATVIADAVAA